MPRWIKRVLVVSCLSFFWGASSWVIAQHFFTQGAIYGYHVAARECSMHVLKNKFERKR